MARPEKHDVDYFPFFAKSGKTLDFLELKYGPEGTGYFTNILRLLALTPDHYFCIKEETEKMVFLSRIKSTDEKKTFDIIEIMVKTGKLDRELWEKHKIIKCQSLIDSLEYIQKKNNIGKYHWNWKGGITPENSAIRNSKCNKKWRKSVFKRDNYTCQSCGKKGHRLNVHHIKPFSKFPELRFDIDNGITLCIDCHKEYHRKNGRGNE